MDPNAKQVIEQVQQPLPQVQSIIGTLPMDSNLTAEAQQEAEESAREAQDSIDDADVS